MSLYNYATGRCECFSGYVFNGSYCISKEQSCWDKYGYNSTYNYLSDTCKCKYGYVWNSSGTRCISGDESCHDQLGIMSSYNSLSNTCDCFPGYTIQFGTCQLKPYVPSTIYIPPVVPQKTNYTPIPTATPTPTQILNIKASMPNDYNSKTKEYSIKFDWGDVPSSKGYSVSISKVPGEDPGPLIDTYKSVWRFNHVKAGKWYLNLKSKNVNWSQIAYWTIELPNKETRKVK